jgi:hypothetical protein
MSHQEDPTLANFHSATPQHANIFSHRPALAAVLLSALTFYLYTANVALESAYCGASLLTSALPVSSNLLTETAFASSTIFVAQSVVTCVPRAVAVALL